MPSRKLTRTAFLISGGGTTMHAIITACQKKKLTGINPVVVIASKPGCGGISKALAIGIPTKVVSRINFGKNTDGVKQYGKVLLQVLKRYKADVVMLNGFLPQISQDVIAAYKDFIFNQHPGPVPEFGGEGMYGRRVHAAVLMFNRLTNKPHPFTEVIAQRVHPHYDQGAVVKSAQVVILSTDTVEDLQARALPIEHRVQIEFLKDVASGTIKEVRHTSFVRTGEEEILERAKEAAKALYPRG